MALLIVVNVVLFVGLAALLVWYLPRVIRAAAKAETARLLNQWQTMCPVAQGILGRVQTVEAKLSQSDERAEKAARVIQKLDGDLRDVKEQKRSEKPRPAPDMGFTPSWGGR